MAAKGQIWKSSHGVPYEVKILDVNDEHQTIKIQYILEKRNPCLTIYLDVFYGFFEYVKDEDKPTDEPQ